ncbi:hypothetical protein [Sporosarcina ureae]|uniref:hypothetical protein n=1 Tax=Sporosarcina ureae TaxID=1571 RepID=UPI0026EC218D|nr:hypothetical protein [Sporosarcina ureae]
MIQSTNQILLYRKIDSAMSERAGIEVGEPHFYYESAGGLKEIELGPDFNDVLTINEFDQEWTPVENNLLIKQKYIFNDPTVLFGEDGVTVEENRIGLAVHIYSKTSSIQKTVSFASFSDSQNRIEFLFEHSFPAASLRGSVEMDFFLFLKDNFECKPYQADQVGMILSEGNLYSLTIVVDGEGSAFPITEFNQKDGPLWLLDKNWADATEDSFDNSNINLKLNVAHPLFEQIKSGKTRASRSLMGDIMVQAMSMIIQQVVIIEGNSLDAADDAVSNSILSVVNYWVITFEVDISTLFTIPNSLRSRFDSEMMGGGKHDQMG